DLTPQLLDDIGAFCDSFPQVLADMEVLLNENRIFKQRNCDIGVLDADEAYAWGFSGPCIRASGVAWDIRKAEPYEVYDRMDFDIPVGKHGDCFDRFMIRIEEMKQSIRIMRQCLNEMPAGPVSSLDRKIVPPRRAEMK